MRKPYETGTKYQGPEHPAGTLLHIPNGYICWECSAAYVPSWNEQQARQEAYKHRNSPICAYTNTYIPKHAATTVKPYSCEQVAA